MVTLENLSSGRTTISPEDTKKKRKFFIEKKDISGWLVILPSLILFSFFIWGPLIRNVILSFFEGFSLKEFRGFENYVTIFHDATFVAAFRNTFLYIFWSLIIGFFFPIILGIMLSEVRHCKALFRIGLYLPCVISGVAASFLFKTLYSPEPYSVLNTILTNLGLPTSRFTSDPKLAIPLIVVARTWRGAGGTILIYLSAIQTIDTNQFEAVRLDGGGFISRLNHVVLAHLKPTISTLFIRQIISVFQVFYEPMIITSTNNPNTISLMLKSYTYAFEDGKPELGAAVGVILSLIILLFTGLYFLVQWFFDSGKKKAK